MSFDVQAAKTGLIALLGTVTGLAAVHNGAPESMPTAAEAWVNVGDLVRPTRASASGGLYELRVNLIVMVAFIIESGNEQAAEDSVAAIITGITLAVLRNRVGTVGGVTSMLNGSVQTMEAPGPAASPSEYLTMAGQEVRAYPLSVEIVQKETVS